MRIKLFVNVKTLKVCYSTGKNAYAPDGRYQLSPRETALALQGWSYAGQIFGRDLSGGDKVDCMTKELNNAKA